MSDLEKLETSIAEDFYQAVQDWSNRTERAQQDADRVIGISSIGHCSEYVRRMLMHEEESQTPDKLAAFIGTWVGAGVEQAILLTRPDAIIQSEVVVTLETDQGTFTITGHPDVILPEGIVLDNKTVNKLAAVTSYSTFETNLQKKFQRHLYALGAHEAGMFGDLPLEEVKVGNLWVDRSASDHEFHVRLEPFDPQVIEHAKDWLSTVVYAYKQGIEAPKEPQRTFCENWCEFFGPCRGVDTDVEGLITDPRALRAVDLYKEGMALESEGKKMKDQAKSELVEVEGSTGSHIVRWVLVGSAEVAYTRAPYTKLTIQKMK